MKHLLISTSVTLLFAVLALSAPAQTPPPKRAQLQADLANLEIKEIDLKEQRKRNEARERKEKEEDTAIAKGWEEYEKDNARFQEENRRHEQTWTTHRAECKGTFTDPDHVRKCNERARGLNAWDKALDGRKTAVTTRYGELDGRRAKLKTDKAETVERKRKNKADLEEVEKKIAAKREAIRIDDSFLNDPRRRKSFGEKCAELQSAEAIKDCAARVFGQ